MLIFVPNKSFQKTRKKKLKRETKQEISETSKSLVVVRQQSPVGNCFTPPPPTFSSLLPHKGETQR